MSSKPAALMSPLQRAYRFLYLVSYFNRDPPSLVNLKPHVHLRGVQRGPQRGSEDHTCMAYSTCPCNFLVLAAPSQAQFGPPWC